jgi:FkbM family methyltransferase
MSEDKVPFIIWTLRRTGGTNLTQQLVRLSGLSGTEHEPFNKGRKYGHITEKWVETQDRKALDDAIEQVIAKGQVIKHCVETVPWEISESLARASTHAGYRHLFLHRRNAADRLLSLHFAERSGIWGPKGAAPKDGTTAPKDNHVEAGTPRVPGDLLSAPLPVENLLSHERRCRERLTAVSRLLRTLGTEPLVLAYEDLYRSTDAEQPVRVMTPILRALHLIQQEAEIKAWTASLVGEGDQGTRDKYGLFPGVAELSKRVQGIPPFELNALPIQWRALEPQHPWIERFFIDVQPDVVEVGQPFELGGVLVLRPQAPAGVSLKLSSQAGPQDLEWGIESPRIAKENPHGQNSAQARWRGSARFADESDVPMITLCWDAEIVPVAEVLRVEEENEDQVYRELEDRLILDIGANDGADTWYYLRKGFRVVAVEAIPDLAEGLRERLPAQISASRLIVVQKAITMAEGEVEITVNQDRTEWSSAHRASKALSGAHHQISVAAVTLAALIQDYGRPYYVKIDIEGGELDAVRSLGELAPKMLPTFISVEINKDIFEVLQLLWDLGFRQFQLVRQSSDHLPSLPNPSREGLDYQCKFNSNMSGPFGLDLPSTAWLGLVEIIRRVIEESQNMKSRAARGENPGWYDVHARFDAR